MRKKRAEVVRMMRAEVLRPRRVDFVDMWLNFVGRDDFFMRDGLHLTGKGTAVLGCEFVRVIDKGTGTINYLN